jgi:hypothetical protein
LSKTFAEDYPAMLASQQEPPCAGVILLTWDSLSRDTSNYDEPKERANKQAVQARRLLILHEEGAFGAD